MTRSDAPGNRPDRSPEGSPETDRLGAYYTGEQIASFVARHALWEALVSRLRSDVEAGRAPEELDPADLSGGDHRPEEGPEPSGFESFYDRYEEEPAVLGHVDATLRDLTVCDPAAGDGSLLCAVAETLFEWRSRCITRDASALRGEILTRNLYGVDRRARATEACRRRLRRWVREDTRSEADATFPGDREPTGPDAMPDEPAFAPLDSRIRTGNSLLGFVDPEPVSDALADAGVVTAPTSEHSPDLTDNHGDLKPTVDERYARAQRETEAVPGMSDRVTDAGAARESLDREAGGQSTLRVTVPEGLPDGLAGFLDDSGFTTYTYTARLDEPRADDGYLDTLFERLRSGLADCDCTVAVERGYAGRDFASDRLDACHWPLAFPSVFRDGGFDVVVGNPPYGAAIDPAAEPLVTSAANYECQGASDTCEWFYERALDLAADDGVVSMVVNKSIAFYSSWSDIRERLLSETAVRRVFDVGLGFDDVDLETLVLVHALDGAGDENSAAVYRSEDPRDPGANRPMHLGWVDQRVMLDAGTIVFRPLTPAQRDALDRVLACERRLGDLLSAEDTARQLYIPDDRKRTLDPGGDAYINKNHWVDSFHLTDVWHRDLGAYRESVADCAVPRVMLKVLRGSRLRAWLDLEGELVGTEKLVNAPLAGHDPVEIAFVYAALNHPCASYYLQTAVFSGTTETARVMDGQYSRPIPIPDPESDVEEAVAVLALTLTLARQVDHDSTRELGAAGDRLAASLDALLGGLYLDIRQGRLRAWSERLLTAGPATDRVLEVFGGFYTARFASRDGAPEEHWEAIETLVAETVAATADWETDHVRDSREMAVVEDTL